MRVKGRGLGLFGLDFHQWGIDAPVGRVGKEDLREGDMVEQLKADPVMRTGRFDALGKAHVGRNDRVGIGRIVVGTIADD